MKLPLIVFTLLYLAILVVYAWMQKTKSPMQAQGSHAISKTKSHALLAEMATDSQRVFALLMVASLLSITFGKPGLGPQYAAWGVVLVQVVKLALMGMGQTGAVFIARLCAYGLIAYLLIIQLPFFDIIPE